MSSTTQTTQLLSTRRVRRITRLFKKDTTDLCQMLLSCSEDKNDWRCGSIACPNCRARAQRSFAGNVRRVLRHEVKPQLVTLIPADGRMSMEKLPAFNLLAFNRRHCMKINRSLPKGLLFVGATDVSVNRFKNGPPWVQFHIHALVTGGLGKGDVAAFRQKYPRDEPLDILRPVNCKAAAHTDLRSIGCYLMKAEYLRRSIFLKLPTATRPEGRSSNGQPLSASEDAQLYATLGKYQITDLPILIGVKRKRTSDPTKFRFDKTTRKES